jgi:hypothetical protein
MQEVDFINYDQTMQITFRRYRGISTVFDEGIATLWALSAKPTPNFLLVFRFLICCLLEVKCTRCIKQKWLVVSPAMRFMVLFLP